MLYIRKHISKSQPSNTFLISFYAEIIEQEGLRGVEIRPFVWLVDIKYEVLHGIKPDRLFRILVFKIELCLIPSYNVSIL